MICTHSNIINHCDVIMSGHCDVILIDLLWPNRSSFREHISVYHIKTGHSMEYICLEQVMNTTVIAAWTLCPFCLIWSLSWCQNGLEYVKDVV